MSDVMVDQRQFEDQAAPATARGHSKQSVNSATSLPTAGRARLQPRNTDIQSFADVRPVIQGWLRNYDQVFMPLEEKTGIPREMMFYIACAFFSMYLVLGSAAGLLCNFIGFAYPAYRSVIAIRTEQKDDDTQWLIYWTTFATFSVLDFFAEGIYHVMPLYWLLKLAFLLYLALPQTLGAHNLYVKYVDPAFDKLNEKVLRPLGIGGGRD